MKKLIALLLCILLLPIAASGEEVMKLEIDLEIMHDRLTRANEQIDALYQQIAELKLQLRLSEKEDPTPADFSVQDPRATETLNQNEQLTSYISMLQSELAEMTTRTQELQDKLTAVQNQNAATIAQLDSTNARLTAVTARYDEAAAKLASTQAELTEATNRQALASHRLAETESALAICKKELSSLQKAHEELQLQLTSARNARVTIEKEQTSVVAQLADMQEKYADAQTRYEKMHRQMAELELKYADAQMRYTRTAAALDAAQAEQKQQQEALIRYTSQLAAMTGMKSKIAVDLVHALAADDVVQQIDMDSGDITLHALTVLPFDSGSAELTEEGKQFLDFFVPAYFGVLLQPQYADYISSISIEGHMAPSEDSETASFLAQERALNVMLYINDMYQNDEAAGDRINQLLSAVGMAYYEPVYTIQNQVDAGASDRIVFSFTLRDAEVLRELTSLLNNQ
ncbi:MAG: OmpA family protein [Clostridia bacterium]|nr:OmpA family protein [Clostridia bacterium]